LLTRDILEKRRKVDDASCLFCAEKEIVCHLIFECVVTRKTWEIVSEVVGVRLGYDYESIAKLWLCNTKFGVINIFSLTVPWTGMSIPDQMLEDTGSFEDGRRLWKCVLKDGEEAAEARANQPRHMPELGAWWC
jgi:hypothetical protein